MSVRHALRRARCLVVPLAAFVVAVLAVPVTLAAPALPSGIDATADRVRAIKRTQMLRLREGTRRVLEARVEARREARGEARREARGDAHRRHARTLPGGTRLKPAPEELERQAIERYDRRPALSPAAVSATQGIPSNVRVNDPGADAATATQAEQGSAALGTNVLAAWNDGQASFDGSDYQGYGTSVDGGVTFVDGGTPPHPAAFLAWRWTSDPVVTVNEKTGEFFYCGLASSDATHNALGVARGHFSGASFVWDGVAVLRNVANTSNFIDKPWCVADSSGAGTNVYVAYTLFSGSSDEIDLQRSTDGGATWAAKTQLSDPLDAGLVQGARVAVGPAGQLYAVWATINLTTDANDFKLRTSANLGVSFGAAVIPASYIDNHGTGAPGFNRERGITFPSIAVDRTAGAHRGRVYLAWNESYDYLNDPLPGSNVRAEVEPNGSFASATPFVVPGVLEGNIGSASPADLDLWKVPLLAGQRIIIDADSLKDHATYVVRIYCPDPDSTQRFAFGANLDSTATFGIDLGLIYTFCAPANGTYYLRMAPATATSITTPYRIRVGFGTFGGERGRDQRDVFVASSDNGVAWSAPVRVNDDPVGFDDYLPEVAVGAEGFPYLAWLDFRDDAFGSRTHVYASRSADGGATWEPSRRLTDVQGNFTTAGSNLAPNMGDYLALATDARFVRPLWADARGASVDVWSARLDTEHRLSGCPPPQTVAPHQPVTLKWTVSNLGAVFPATYAWTLSSSRDWGWPASGSVTVQPLDSTGVTLDVAVPDTAASGTQTLTFVVTRGTKQASCTVALSVTAASAVGDPARTDFALLPVTPNPAHGHARMAFTLPRAASVSLALYGLNGERVRTLLDGERPAGTTTLEWDGHDARGAVAPAGLYFLRLEGLGERRTRQLVWMK